MDYHPTAPRIYNPYADPQTAPKNAPLEPAQPNKILTAQELLNLPSTAYLVMRLPTVATLSVQLDSVQEPSYDPAGQLAWCRDVLGLVERNSRVRTAATWVNQGLPGTPAQIADSELQHLADVAVRMLLKLAARKKAAQNFVPGYVAGALYLCATVAASGAFPQYIPHNPGWAFGQWEQTARAGYHPAWLDLARDFEKFGDMQSARECYEHGAEHVVPGCLFRLGMAHLSGQLCLPRSPERGLSLLRQAASLSTVDTPHPAYDYAMLLLSQLPDLNLPPHLLALHVPPGSTPAYEARQYMERSAYLAYAPAQIWLGQAYEFADEASVFPFDAVLSVQFYSLAASQGDAEAEMSLSKWLLCGCEGVFAKDESLAFKYAAQAAKKGLPSAMFAIGYYAEIGVGCEKDLAEAQKWYRMAAQQGNADATERLQAISQSSTISRKEHEQLTETTLVRKRIQTRMRSATTNDVAPAMPALAPVTATPSDSSALDEIRTPVVTMSPPSRSTTLPPTAVASSSQDGYLEVEIRFRKPRGRTLSEQQQNVGVPRIRLGSLKSDTASSGGPSPASPRGPGYPPAHSRGPSPAPARLPMAGRRRTQSHSALHSSSLTDTPSPSAGPRPLSVPPQPDNAMPPPRARSPLQRKMQAMRRSAQTFAEMGIFSGKARSEGCIVM